MDIEGISFTSSKGMRYEAAWGRKRANSRRFIGRIHAYQEVADGPLPQTSTHEEYQGEVWRCDHAHQSQAEGRACAQEHIAILVSSANDTADEEASEEDPAEREQRRQAILQDISDHAGAAMQDPQVAAMADAIADQFSDLGIGGIAWR